VKRILAFFLFSSVLFSCDPNRTPAGILTEDKVVNVLIDIQLTEGMVSALPIPYDSSQVLYSLMEKDVFIKHGVEDSVFINSMIFYLEDARKMDKIYARVIDSLVVRESVPGKKEDLF
jgi:hypothetical protein